jgi:hypothetical protein
MAPASCPHCGGRLDTAAPAVAAAVGVVVEPGPRTVAEAAALRAALARILRMMLEVATRRRPAGQLVMLTEPPVLRYLRAAQPTGPVALQSVRVCVPAEQVAEAKLSYHPTHSSREHRPRPISINGTHGTKDPAC